MPGRTLLRVHPLLEHAAARQAGVFTPADARRAGYTDEEIARRIAGGSWRRLRRGVYATDAEVRAAEATGNRHRLECAAVLLALGRRTAVVSHGSAARLWGLLTPTSPGTGVRLTDTGQWREGRGYRVAEASLPPEDVRTAFRLPVTAVPRTLVDCAREWDLVDAVVAMDDALQRDLVGREDLQASVLAATHWPGAAGASRALNLADGRAESPLETRGRLRLLAGGLPAPWLQVEIADERGVVGVVDAWYDDAAVAVEFDGRTKFDAPWDDRSPGEVLWREKRREDRLRAVGIRVVRIAAADLSGPEELALLARLRRMLAEPVLSRRSFRAVRRPDRRLRPAG